MQAHMANLPDLNTNQEANPPKGTPTDISRLIRGDEVAVEDYGVRRDHWFGETGHEETIPHLSPVNLNGDPGQLDRSKYRA